jgi:hypothetical protein
MTDAYLCMEQWWDYDRGKLSIGGKVFTDDILSSKNPTKTGIKPRPAQLKDYN